MIGRRLTVLLAIAGLVFLGMPTWARTAEGNETTDKSAAKKILRSFGPYGILLGHVAVTDGEAEIQDNTSWLGFKVSTGNDIRLFAHFEAGVNLIGGAPPFRAGSTTGSGFLTLEGADEPPVFGNRLGYLGVDFGKGGTLGLGKQNSVHYSIASYTTDRFGAFGGHGSLAYPAGGDGGSSGTGRADQSIVYRVPAGERVDLGLQAVFSNSTNNEVLDGYGASLEVEIVPQLKIGGAYSQVEIEDVTEGLVRGVDGDAEYAIVGINYASDVVELGAVYASQKNGDLVNAPDLLDVEPEEPVLVPVAFDADGLEVYVRGFIGDFSVVGGYIDYSPDTDDSLLDPDFRTRYYILGGKWMFAENAALYSELRFDDSVGADGVAGTNAGVLGFEYAFSWKGSHGP